MARSLQRTETSTSRLEKNNFPNPISLLSSFFFIYTSVKITGSNIWFMDDLLGELREVEGVKAVERHGDFLKLKLFSKKVTGNELYRIPGDLRRTSQEIKTVLENSGVRSWNIVAKPQKKYRDKAFKDSKVSDRESKGYKRNYYEVSVRE